MKYYKLRHIETGLFLRTRKFRFPGLDHKGNIFPRMVLPSCKKVIIKEEELFKADEFQWVEYKVEEIQIHPILFTKP